MSYCVNCGVELEAARKTCPLCGIKVINPLQQETEETLSYPKQKDEFKKKDRLFWMKFISVLLAMPIITCIISDLLVTHTLSWSVYVIAGVTLLWVLFTTPLYFKKFNTVRMLFIDITSILIFLALIEALTDGKPWFLPLALPICAYVLLSSLVIIALYRILSLRGLGISAAILISIGLMIPGLETIADVYNNGSVSLFWSWFVMASCFSVATLLIMLGNNKRFRTALKKRLHF